MQKSEKSSFVGTLLKPFKNAVLPALSILGIAVGQDNVSNTVQDSSLFSGDKFAMSDTTKPIIINPEVKKILTSYDSLKAHNISLDSAAKLAQNLPDSSKSLPGVWDYFSNVKLTIPKP